ncbi:unnamed protein product [Paramecium sonneborni]|uniref:Uncharacterized protein n=1 Tax=Paramecium sonneborni TaxID=65129 RepID=A0A8S1RLW3_9CILI|nr:unnamed protein product [Paramecium sonneborni]
MQLKFSETDGFVYDLLHFLWLKDPISKKAPKINIPYTLQIKAGQVKFWYFSKEGVIYRKSKEKLDPDYLKQLFNSDKTNKTEAVWVFEENDKLKFNYMNKMEVGHFIEKLDYLDEGILQGFIYPKRECNSTIKCVWQKNSCIFEQIYNINKIQNNSLNPNQRITTFETDGGPTISTTLNSNVLAQSLELICQEICQHINNVTFEKIKISLMELYFRQGEDGLIYLLFCSKVRTTTQKSNSSSNVRLTLKVPLPKGPNIVEYTNQRCVGCKVIQNVNLFEEITIREIIESWDRHHEIKYRQDPPIIEMDKNCLVPKILRFIYPSLDFNHYQGLKSNSAFTYQKIKLCLKCYKNVHDNKSRFSTATYSIQKKIMMRQKSSQSTFQYDTQSIKKSLPSQESFTQNTQSQTKNNSTHKRSISNTSYMLKYRCSTQFVFNQSISQIFRNEQSQQKI